MDDGNLYMAELKTSSKTMGNSSSKKDSSKIMKAKGESKIFVKSGKPCPECQGVKSMVDLASNERLFCIHCLGKSCKQEIDNILFRLVLRKVSQRLFKFKTILKERTEELFIQYKDITREQINDTTVNSTITLSKRFETSSIQSEQTTLLENCMQIKVMEITEDNHELINDAITVRIENNYRCYCAGIFEKGNTPMEKTFVKGFVDKLKSEPIKVIEVEDCLQYFQRYDGPLFVVCLLQSRLNEDVLYALQEIEEQFFGRIILVLLHFKIEDTSCKAKNVKDSYSGLRVIDYFQQKQENNIEDVMQIAKELIFSDY